MNGYYIKAITSFISRTTAKLLKTGQTISFRTGDDGDLEEGRDIDFITLNENNPFGTTDRFTDELGTQVYVNDIVIDWSTYDGNTVFGFRRTFTSGKTWDEAIDECLLVSIGAYTSGWRLPNIKELLNLFTYGAVSLPYTLSTFISSTTFRSVTTYYFQLLNDGRVFYVLKTSTANYIPCRTFTVSGTTLL